MRRTLFALATLVLACPATADPLSAAGFEVTSYDLALTPDLQNETIAGRQTIRLCATGDGLQRLVFSSNALSIDSATLNGVPVTAASRSDSVTFALSKPIPHGRTVKLEFVYHRRPARGFAALRLSWVGHSSWLPPGVI